MCSKYISITLFFTFSVLILGCDREIDEQGLTAQMVFPPAGSPILRNHLGDVVDFDEYQGRVVVLNFWATWCGPCRYEIPDLVRLQREYDPNKVIIVGVSLDRGDPNKIRQKLTNFIDRYEINYPILLDEYGEFVRKFLGNIGGSLPVPMTFVFDQEGNLYSRHIGVPRKNDGTLNPYAVLNADISKLL